MEKSIILVLLFLVSNLMFSQKNDIDILDLKGKIKEIKYYTDKNLMKSILFNEAGNITEYKEYSQNKLGYYGHTSYDKKGNKISDVNEFITTHYTYDDLSNNIQITHLKTYNNDTSQVIKNKFIRHNLIETKTYGFSQNGKRMTDKILYEYDNSNNKIKEINFGVSTTTKRKPYRDVEDKSPLIYYYSYDKSSNLLEKVCKNEEDITLNRYSYKYDLNNNKVESCVEAPTASSFLGCEKNVYDEQNNLIENSKYSVDNELQYKDEYVFNKNNKLILKTHYLKDEKVSSIEYKYDVKNNRIEETTYIKGKLRDIIKRIFDDYGNEINSKIIDSNGKIIILTKKEISYYK